MLKMPDYVYMRGAQPLLQWRGGIPPRPIRAADNVALGNISMVPGGPEAIQGFSSDEMFSFALGAAAGGVVAYLMLGAFLTRGSRR
jgi:hypothetical protein